MCCFVVAWQHLFMHVTNGRTLDLTCGLCSPDGQCVDRTMWWVTRVRHGSRVSNCHHCGKFHRFRCPTVRALLRNDDDTGLPIICLPCFSVDISCFWSTPTLVVALEGFFFSFLFSSFVLSVCLFFLLLFFPVTYLLSYVGHAELKRWRGEQVHNKLSQWPPACVGWQSI